MYKEMYLMLTEACPNRCEYCYIRHRDNPSSITMDIVDEKIEKYHPNRIIFFGGEPLVRLDLMKEIVKKYYGKIKFQVVTSTSINFKEFIEFNKEYPLDEIQISWDGFNRNRLNATGIDTSYTVWKNIIYAIRQGLKFDIKAVVSNNNVNQFVRLHKIFKQLKPFGVSGQFVVAHRDEYTEDFYTEFEKQLINTFDLDKMYVDHLNKIIAYLTKDKNYSSCDGGKYIVIDPRGDESCCTALSQNPNIKVDSDTIQEPCLHEDCIKCKYLYMCDGGCRYERINAFGEKWKTNYLKSTCKMVKIYTNTIYQWLNSLNGEDIKRLQHIIIDYKRYLRGYYETK